MAYRQCYIFYYPTSSHYISHNLLSVPLLPLLIPLARPLRSLRIDLRLDRGLGVFLPVRTKDARQELSNLLLVDLVLGVLASGNVFGQRSATSEDTKVCERASSGPVPPTASAVRSPRI